MSEAWSQSANTPFQTTCSLNFFDYGNNVFVGLCDLVKVPRGNMAVIEHVSMSASLAPQASITGVALSTSVKGDGGGVYHDIVPTFLGAANSSYTWLASSPVHLYSDPRSTITFVINLYGLNVGSGSSGRASISGYYTPVSP